MGVDIELYGIPAVALVVALTTLAKNQPWFPRPYAPILAVALGILAGMAYYSAMTPLPGDWWRQALVQGVVLGLVSTGAYAGVAHIAETQAAGNAGTAYKEPVSATPPSAPPAPPTT